VAEVAGAMLNRDRISSRRRWIIALFIFSLIVITLTATPRYRLGRSREFAFPVPHSDTGYSKMIEIKEFVKPKNVTIIGLVFFGRKNRVEMLRCYLEVGPQLAHLKPAFSLTQM
jgi:hypothetical protein